MLGPVDAAVRSFLTDVLPPNHPVTVACSGGADSLALALATLRAVGPERSRAITIDHRLQSGSAVQAESAVRQLRDLGYLDAQVRSVSVGTTGGPEAAARQARYGALAAGAGDERAVLLAHTLDDQAETVLLGLARGSGPRSIAGMLAWRPPWGRPLLTVRRSDTEQYCRAAGLTWWSDPHNLDPRFTRVRLRREVLPLLEDVLGRGVPPALARTAQLMREDLQALDLISAQVLEVASVADRELNLTVLAAQPSAIRSRVLRTWATAVGCRALTSDHLTRLDGLCLAAKSAGPTSGAVRLPGAVDAVRRGSTLVALPVETLAIAGPQMDGSEPGMAG